VIALCANTSAMCPLELLGSKKKKKKKELIRSICAGLGHCPFRSRHQIPARIGGGSRRSPSITRLAQTFACPRQLAWRRWRMPSVTPMNSTLRPLILLAKDREPAPDDADIRAPLFIRPTQPSIEPNFGRLTRNGDRHDRVPALARQVRIRVLCTTTLLP